MTLETNFSLHETFHVPFLFPCGIILIGGNFGNRTPSGQCAWFAVIKVGAQPLFAVSHPRDDGMPESRGAVMMKGCFTLQPRKRQDLPLSTISLQFSKLREM